MNELAPEGTLVVKKKTSPRDFFLHLLAIVTLYIVAASFLGLIFQYINILFPDPLERDVFFRQGAYQTIRWSMAALIIVYPLHIWIAWYLNKQFVAFPEKRQARIRRWLVYFTLFAAAIAIVIDLITLVFRFLGGELTVRFVLKVITVFLVAGTVLGYYFWDIRKGDDK